ncbi:hypothetical protein ACIQM4_32230 [Streptomyces sp. NPDC091272]|uniref:hypothetical protein n=1 Tax=Streptomyces sp. NPDC091272 TaxID=3365981 RepID=UPI0038296F09
MLRRIATALAVATVAGFMATGTAVAADNDNGVYGEGRHASHQAYNLGGPYGITHTGTKVGGYRYAVSFDHADNDD